jgi:hypothetical protein
MNRVNIDGVTYEKVEIKGWEDLKDPNEMYLTYRSRMYKLIRITPLPSVKTNVIENNSNLIESH